MGGEVEGRECFSADKLKRITGETRCGEVCGDWTTPISIVPPGPEIRREFNTEIIEVADVLANGVFQPRGIG